MNNNQRKTCITEAFNYRDRDAYITDLSLSSIWDDCETAPIPADRLEMLAAIYDAVHRNVRDIVIASGMSARKLAERFSIPYRTMENWCSGVNECPVYTQLMIQEIIGLLHLK